MTDEELIEAWHSGMSETQISEEYGVPVEEVIRRRRQELKLRRRSAAALPTEEEIWGVLTKQIQEGWTEMQRAARWRGPRRVEWEMPRIGAGDDFSEPDEEIPPPE